MNAKRIIQNQAKEAVFKIFSKFEGGTLTLIEHNGKKHVFGTTHEIDGVHAKVVFYDPGMFGQVLRGSAIIGQSYAQNRWDTDNLVTLFRFAARNVHRLDQVRAKFSLVTNLWESSQRFQKNTEKRSKKQIEAHYDLSNRMFQSFLDPTMSYSGGLFETKTTTLQEAQKAKMENLCKTMQLQKGESVVEIGSGWGGLAIYMAKNYGVKVTTVTISNQQYLESLQRIKQAGIDHLVDIRLQDYRQLEGQFDHLVSVEMIEAVGWKEFPTYFTKCSQLLKPTGNMALQAITIEDSAYEIEKRGKSFANTVIFPGGCLPSKQEINRCIKKYTNLEQTLWLDMTTDYATTLNLWRKNFNQTSEKEKASMGLDKAFERTWNLYLAYCEAGFMERRIQLGQTLYQKI